MHKTTLKAKEVCQNLKMKVSEEHYLLIQAITEMNSRENEFIKKK